jgi:hypothetical protein
MVVHTYNPSTWEAEAGGSRVQGQPGLHNEILYENNHHHHHNTHTHTHTHTHTLTALVIGLIF